MKVAIVGAEGQLGADVCDEFRKNSDEVHPLSHGDVEVADLEQVKRTLTAVEPEVIVNTAAFHNVEQCEQDPAKSFAINALGARNLALVANNLGAILMHVSTDYVFDGSMDRPYEEQDVPRPLNVYGNSKLAGECFVRSTTGRHFVLRTSALYGKHPCRAKGGLNFVELMLKLAREREELRVVGSEVVTPTSTAELARQIVKLSRCDAFGLYHTTAEGSCSWYEFAREIFMLTDTKIRLNMAAPNEFPSKVLRPTYSVLENRGLKTIGQNLFRDWQEGLREYLGLSKRVVQTA